MADCLNLNATLEPRGGAAAVLLSDEHVAALGQGKKAFPVQVTVNGRYSFAGRVARMGTENMVGFTKAVREAAGVAPGDVIDVVLALDLAERSVDVPDDLAVAMTEAGIVDRFSALAPSHRKEYVRWITEAKKPETRAKRVAEATELIAEGKPRR